MTDTPERGRVSRRRLLQTTTGLVITGSLAGCTGDGGDGGDDGNTSDGGGETTETPTPTGSPSKLTFGAPKAAAAGVSSRVARDRGFADDRELDITLEFGAPPELFTKLQGRNLESSTFPVISGARLANQDRAIRLLQPVARSFNSIIARKGEGLSNVEDLQETTLGTMPQKTAPFTHFALLLALNGLSHTDYEFQFGPPPVLFGQMQKGELDAMIGVEPFSTRLLATDEFEEFFVFNEEWQAERGTNMPLVEVATYQSSLDEKADAFEAWTEALIEAGQYISDNPTGVFEEYSDVLGLQNDEQIELATERIALIYPTEFATELRESGKEIVRLAAEEGLIEKEPPLNELFVDPRTL